MSILQALAGYYDRLVTNGQAPEYGYSRERISYAVALTPDGEPVDVVSLLDTSSRRPRPSLRPVPRPFSRTSGVASNFLWDKTAYVFGVKRDRDTEQPVPAEREHAAFKTLHERLLARVSDDGLQALRSFLDEWQPDQYESLTHARDMLDANVVFLLNGEMRFLHDRPAARRVWLDHLSVSDGTGGLCLVSGERTPIARVHPKVKGVKGAQGSGAAIVSFNLDAFKSFGKDQGSNAPVSDRAAFAYTTALNKLLERDSRQRVQIGDATTVFWAEAAKDGRDATAAEDLFAMLAEPPSDSEETAAVADKLKRFEKGRPLSEVVPDVRQDTRFYVLGLAPNAARISIRFWYEETIGDVARRILEHFHDLRLDPTPWQTPPAAWRLLLETAVQGKAKNVPPTLCGALMRSILTGYRYPQSLLTSVIMRIRADGDINGRRAAICKACLARDYRLDITSHAGAWIETLAKEDVPVSIATDSDNVAYNLGRLFAIYAYAEKSLTDRNATIRDRYAGSASATPRLVFPRLMRGYEHNRSSLAKGDRKKQGAGTRANRAVGDVIELLPGHEELPAILPFQDQARFFVGYYHQERVLYTKADSDDRHQSVPSEENEE